MYVNKRDIIRWTVVTYQKKRENNIDTKYTKYFENIVTKITSINLNIKLQTATLCITPLISKTISRKHYFCHKKDKTVTTPFYNAFRTEA